MKTYWTEKFLLILACIIAVSSWGTAGRCASDFRTPNEAGLSAFTYKQMMRLSLEDRAAYLRFLRDFMIQEQNLYPTSWDSAGLNGGNSDSIAALFWSVAEAQSGAAKDTGRICYFGGNRAHVEAVTDSKNQTRYICWAQDVEDENGAKADDSFCRKQTVNGIPGVACNRMIFGADSSKNPEIPYCVSRGQNATRDCDKNFDDKDAKKAAKRFQSMTPADQAKWNDYVSKLEDFCKKSPTPECSTLTSRLATIKTPLPTDKSDGTPTQICTGLDIPSDQTGKCAGGNCNSRTWLMGVPDPQHKGRYTDLQFLRAPTSSEKTGSSCQDSDQKCYDQIKPIAGSVKQDADTGVVTIQFQSQNGVVPVNTIDISNDGTHCSITRSREPAKSTQTDPCKTGTPYCASDNWPQCGNTNPEHYLIQDKRNGHDKTAHMNADGTSDLAVTTEDKTPRSSEAFAKHLDSLSNPSQTDTHGADDMKAIQDWAKEAGADSRKNAAGGVSKDFGANADPGDVGVALNSPNIDYVEGVMNDLAVQKKSCPTSASWIKITEAQKTTWEGADKTQFYACGTIDSKGKVKSLGGAYLKLHFNKDGTPLMTETGQLDKNGREISANLFRPNDYTPYISIGFKMKADGKTPVENEGRMPWHKTREFEATVNHSCPSATERYMAVLTETDPSTSKTTFRTCTSLSATSGFGEQTKYQFTQGSDGTLTAADPYYTNRTLKLAKDADGKCLVARKLTEAADSTYQAAPTSPFTAYGDYMKAPTPGAAGQGNRQQ